MYNLYNIKIMNERLRQLRKEKGVEQKVVAKAIGVTVNAYAHYEQGIREPSYDILVKIAKYFDVSTDYLLGVVDYY